MKILIDTNVLISSALFPNSISSKAYFKAVNNNKVIICDYELTEMKSVFQKKFPHKIDALNNFIASKMDCVHIVKVPSRKSKYTIRDMKDEPILRTALYYNVDIILTGDLDFSAIAMTKPKVVTPSEFLYK